MYSSLQKILFALPPEKAHHLTMGALNQSLQNSFMHQWVEKKFSVKDNSLQKKIWGLNFKNPVGLAAGFDKDAKYIDALAALGFGHVEIGTLTPKPQPGNPQPRLFRLKKDQALINRMGFNNDGVDAAVKRLEKVKSNVIIGGNIGKNKVTPNHEAVNDYVYCFQKLYNYVDYFVVNVSSPNTPNLRELQEKEPLKKILLALQNINHQQKPILLKIAPDLTHEQLDDIIEIVIDTKLAGIVATNTTIGRENLLSSKKIEIGGLSGLPVQQKSTEIIRYLKENSHNSFKIIGIGGIFDGKDAQEKLDAGADLIQVYTGFIYQGPSIVKDICSQLITN